MIKVFKLSAHDKPITKVLFNREGDLLFVASKDKIVTVWFTKTGEILGSFHAPAAVYDIDVTPDSKYLAVGAGDGTVTIFDVRTGKELHQEDVVKLGQVTCVKFHPNGRQLFTLTPYSKIVNSLLKLYTFNPSGEVIMKYAGFFENTQGQTSMYTGCWSPAGKNKSHDYDVAVACNDGSIRKFFYSGKEEISLGDALERLHDNDIKDISLTPCRCFLLTASLDKTSRLIQVDHLKQVKVFQSNEPINSASYSPIKNHVICGGGTSALHVTTTHRQEKTFNPTFYHAIYEKDIANVKGHFGTINTLRFGPNGRYFASGGEDSFVRLYHFSQKYIQSKESKTDDSIL